MASLSHLSPEVVAQILRFLAPIDIFSMRKTCRQCYSVTKFKTVWVTALDEVCERHGIFKATYPMDEMSLQELERAAMAPRMFVESIKENSARGTVPPYRSRSLRDPSSDQRIDVRSLILVPGGRFLLTAGRDSVCLWDLGCNTFVPMDGYPLATLERGSFYLHAVVPSLDKKALIVAVQSPLEDVVEILRIDPQSVSPAFRVEGRLDLGSLRDRSGIVYLTHSTAFIQHSRCLWVWKWAENTGLRWGLPLKNRSKILFVSDTLIIGSDKGCLHTWKSPSPSDFKPLPENLEEMDMARFEPSYVEQVAEDEFSLCATSIWQRDPSLSQEYLCLVLDGCDNVDERNPGLSLFSLGRPPAQNEPLLPIERGHNMLHYGDSLNLGGYFTGLSPLFKCEDYLVFCSWSNQYKMVVTIMPTPKDADCWHPYLELQSANLTVGQVPDGWAFNNLGFCPMSGRLVHFERNMKIWIKDYLVAPDKSL